MRPTVKPAKRLTADCIWNSFRNSGKRHIILTGDRGIGKTTLLSQLFPEKLPGLTSFVTPGESVSLQDNLTGEIAQIGIYDSALSGKENRMRPFMEGFLSLGVATLGRCCESECPWASIDEIGYLEALCGEYLVALEKLFEKKQVAAVVRKDNIPFLRKLCSREDAFVVDLDDPFGNIGCVIMASGLGKRFGSNKLMADFRDKPMICYALDATEYIFSQRVVVTRHKDVAELCEKRGVKTVYHSLPFRSDTIRLGLEVIKDAERCMFLAADQPLLEKNTVEALAIVSKNEPDAILRTVYDDTCGLPVVFPEWSFPELSALNDKEGGGAVIKKHPDKIRTVKAGKKYELADIDTPEELIRLQNKTF